MIKIMKKYIDTWEQLKISRYDSNGNPIDL